MELVLTGLASVAVGLAVGVLSGLLGIGGGTVLVPVFKLAFGMDAIAATATSLFTIIPTSVSGAVSHVRGRTCVPKLGVAAGIGGAVTSPVGVWLATKSPSWAIMAVAALVIGYSGYTMLRKALGCARANAAGAPADAAPPAPFAPTRKHLLQGVCIGLLAGVTSGYVGVGGGFLMVPLMMRFIGLPMKLTSGTSLVAVMILAVPGVIYQALLGNVHWVSGIAVAVGSIPGAALGARLIPRVPERSLRFLFSGFLFVAAVLLIVNQMGVLG